MSKDWAADLAEAIRAGAPLPSELLDRAIVVSVDPLRIDVQGMVVERNIWLPAAIRAGTDPAGPLAVGDVFIVAQQSSAVILLQRVVQAS